MSAAGPVSAPSPPAAARPRRWVAPALLAAVALLFTVGVVRLLELRFGAGDVYPPYSTMRGDPLGAKVFYASLEELPGLEAARNVRPLRRLEVPDEGEPPLTVFYLGADPARWPYLFTKAEAERLETVLDGGGQVVLTFLPADLLPAIQRVRRSNARDGNDDDPARPPQRSRREDADSGGESPDLPADATINLARRWNVDFRRIDRKDRARAPLPAGPAHPAQASVTAPPKLTWHSAVSFELDGGLDGAAWRPLLRASDLALWPRRAPTARGAGWRVFWARDQYPVIVSRDYPGGGRLILATDSYFLSNEALRAELQPDLLAALVGPAKRVVFEETHFGIREDPGLMALARRFNLQWALGALLLAAALFIWKSMASLVPPAARLAAGDGAPAAAVGRDGYAGFLNLLRRSVPARDLLGVCLARWEAMSAGPSAKSRASEAATVARLKAVIEEEAAKPIHRRETAEAYRRMTEAARRKG